MLRRKAMDMSQTQFAQKAGMSRNYLSLIENGNARNISLDYMIKIADVLDVTVGSLATAFIAQNSQEDT